MGEENASLLDGIFNLLDETNHCIRIAERNRKSLTGRNFYAKKFARLVIDAEKLISATRAQAWSLNDPTLIENLDEFESKLKRFFTPDLPRAERTLMEREIRHLLAAKIQPSLKDKEKYSPTDALLPIEIFEGTPGYVRRTAAQAAGCYDFGWYDACAVMLRRLLETLIIECYEHHELADGIKDPEGNFLHLGKLVSLFLKQPEWNVSRNVKKAMPRLKNLGDLSAHNRRYVSRRADIDRLKTDLRLSYEELVHLAAPKD